MRTVKMEQRTNWKQTLTLSCLKTTINFVVFYIWLKVRNNKLLFWLRETGVWIYLAFIIDLSGWTNWLHISDHAVMFHIRLNPQIIYQTHGNRSLNLLGSFNGEPVELKSILSGFIYGWIYKLFIWLKETGVWICWAVFRVNQLNTYIIYLI